MNPESETRCDTLVREHDLVRDVGGGGDPYHRADHVLDIMSWPRWNERYRRRPASTYRVTETTWHEHDACKGRFPFADKMFDFCVCSHMLEDVRDPLVVCEEMVRVAKAGYIETPSPPIELTLGMDPGHRRYAGYCHHRWLVWRDAQGLVFLAKPHFVHESKRFHLPHRFVAALQRRDQHLTRLVWTRSFTASETILLDREDLERAVETVVVQVSGVNAAMRLHRAKRTAWRLGVQAADALRIRATLRRLLAGKAP